MVLSVSPRVSVVIPAYNAQSTIASTLRSILAQSVTDIEVLVVDDCSRDGTAMVVQQIATEDTRCRYIKLPVNAGGPAHPRNVGIEQARAPWIALCDSDDLWHPAKLELQLAAAEQAGSRFLCTQMADFDDEAAIRHEPLPPSGHQLPLVPFALGDLLRKNRIATSSVLIQRALVHEAGGFDPDRGLIAVEDYDLWLRCVALTGKPVLRLEWPLVDYRKAPTSLSGNKLKQARKVWRVLGRHYSRQSSLFARLNQPLMFLHYLFSAVFLRLWMRSL